MAEMEKEMNETSAEETVETVEETVETNPWEEKYNAELDAHLRLAAEFDNFRKRTVKEKESSYSNGRADAVEKILPVYDNLSRALKQETSDAAFKKGVEIFGEVGEEFDPNLHNAVMHTDDDAFGENVICQVFQQGFKMGDKVIRFAMVQVAN